MESVLTVLVGAILGVALTALLVVASVQRAYRIARFVDADPTNAGLVLGQQEAQRMVA